MHIAFSQCCICPSLKPLLACVKPAATFSDAAGTQVLESLLCSLDHEWDYPRDRSFANYCARDSLSNFDGLCVTMIPGFRSFLHRL